MALTEAQQLRRLQLFEKWRNNHGAYCRTCLRIKDKKEQIRPFEVNAAQLLMEDFAAQMRQETGFVRIIVPKARQLGATTGIQARGYRRAHLEDHKSQMVITHRDDSTQAMLSMLNLFTASMDPLFAPELLESNVRGFKFGNGSQYRIGTAGGAGAKVGRGWTLGFFHWSEVAYCESSAGDIAAGAMQAVPNAPGTEVWLESTGTGPSGYFYGKVRDAQAGVGDFRVLFLPWWLDPSYVRKITDLNWTPSGKWQEYQRTYRIDDERLYWAWNKNVDLLRGNKEEVGTEGNIDEPCTKFLLEYPATVEDCFTASAANKLISALKVSQARGAYDLVPDQDHAPKLLGVDVAAGGADRTTLIDRQGRKAGGRVFKKMPKAPPRDVVPVILQAHNEHRFDRIYVDTTGGYGITVCDMLEDTPGLRGVVVPVNYSGKPLDERYLNKRAEMYCAMRDWFDLGPVACPDNDEFVSHVLAPLDVVDTNSRQKIEDKLTIRKREGFSPDWADALCQTFFEPVPPVHRVDYAAMLAEQTGAAVTRFGARSW